MKKFLSLFAVFTYLACFSQKNEKVIKNTDLEIAKYSFEEFDNVTLFKHSSIVKKEDSTSGKNCSSITRRNDRPPRKNNHAASRFGFIF